METKYCIFGDKVGSKYLILVFECKNFIFDCVLEFVRDTVVLKEKRTSNLF